MKKMHYLLIAGMMSALSFGVRANDDEFESFGIFTIQPIGLLGTENGNGLSFGGLGTSIMWNHVIFEVSGLKLGKWKKVTYVGEHHEYRQERKNTAILEIASIDIGFQHTFLNRFNLAIVPYSWTWSTATDGFALLGKSWINDDLLIQAKVVPIAYFSHFGKKWYDNNTYIEIDYYHKDNLIGIRHSRMGGYNSTSLSLTFFVL